MKAAAIGRWFGVWIPPSACRRPPPQLRLAIPWPAVRVADPMGVSDDRRSNRRSLPVTGHGKLADNNLRSVVMTSHGIQVDAPGAIGAPVSRRGVGHPDRVMHSADCRSLSNAHALSHGKRAERAPVRPGPRQFERAFGTRPPDPNGERQTHGSIPSVGSSASPPAGRGADSGEASVEDAGFGLTGPRLRGLSDPKASSRRTRFVLREPRRAATDSALQSGDAAHAADA